MRILFAGADVVIKDASKLQPKANLIDIGVQIKTSIGQIHKPIVCSSEAEFIAKCGPAVTNDLGGWYAKKLLNSGAIRLHVSRVGHYSEGLEGSKADNYISNSNVAETLATGVIAFSGAASTGSFITVTVYRQGQPSFAFTPVQVVSEMSATEIGALVASALTSNGFSATNSSGEVTITAPNGSGAVANNWTITCSLGLVGNTSRAITQFTGGVNGTLAAYAIIDAKAVGTGYNNTVVTITKAASGELNKVDITITVPGAGTEQVLDCKQKLTQDEEEALNSGLQYIDFDLFDEGDGTLPIGSTVLTGGVFDQTTVVANDYIGFASDETGWHSFSGVNVDYIANVNMAVPSVDRALSDFCEARYGTGFSSRFFVRTPTSINLSAVKQYRLGTGSYTSAPLDTYLGRLIGTTLKVKLDTETTGFVSGIAHVLIARAKTDLRAGKGESDSGEGVGNDPTLGFGKITDPDVIEVVDNWYGPEVATTANELYQLGVTPIIKHPSFGFVVWGNRSLLMNQNSLLKFESIANLTLDICKKFQPILERRTFRAGDPTIWRAIYRDALPIILDWENGINSFPPVIVRGEGPTKGWQWLGDQNVATKNDVQFNNVADIDQGIYKIGFPFQPINRMERLTMEATVYDGNTYKLTFTQTA